MKTKILNLIFAPLYVFGAYQDFYKSPAQSRNNTRNYSNSPKKTRGLFNYYRLPSLIIDINDNTYLNDVVEGFWNDIYSLNKDKTIWIDLKAEISDSGLPHSITNLCYINYTKKDKEAFKDLALNNLNMYEEFKEHELLVTDIYIQYRILDSNRESLIRPHKFIADFL